MNKEILKQFEEMVKEHRKDYEDSLKEMTDTDIKLAKISDSYCKEREWIENHTMKCPRCGGLATNQEPNMAGEMVDTKFHCYKCDWDEREDEDSKDIPF